ncbi:hybrid sensory histidine kinase TorS [Salmonella enterica subsp. enterica]|uniref:Hybrid sensory histidine kinase TorS n=1 Tax=Salmonella enterica I TaxID=59201 RepID=A0A447TRX0_SALET|nr:hybrid sensory histidine kinase TorS [Salmonella enterica subsp. enterica]
MKKLNQLVKILSRRQQRIEDPTVRAQIADALEKINQYTTLVTLFRKENAIRDQLQTLMANNLFQFTRFSTEVSQLVNAIEKRNEAGLARLTHASQRGQIGLVILGILALCSLSFILLASSLPFRIPPAGATNAGLTAVYWRAILTHRFRRRLASANWIPSAV